MLGAMYTINRVIGSRSAVTLSCTRCPHTVRVNEFDNKEGCARTKAAQAMLKHVHYEHGEKQIGRPMPRWY